MQSRVGISGLPGSGKTTVAKLLSERKGMRFHSMGMLFRSVAESRGLTLGELSSLAESDRSVDELIDREQTEILRSDGVVMDSRLSCWLMARNDIPGLKVWITAPFDLRAERIAGRERVSVDDVRRMLRARETSEADRYKRYYDIDIRDLRVYDLIINNAWLSPEECCDIIVSVMG